MLSHIKIMDRKVSSRIKTEKLFWIFWKGSLLTSFSISLPLMSDQFQVCAGDSSHSSATTYKKKVLRFYKPTWFPFIWVSAFLWHFIAPTYPQSRTAGTNEEAEACQVFAKVQSRWVRPTFFPHPVMVCLLTAGPSAPSHALPGNGPRACHLLLPKKTSQIPDAPKTKGTSPSQQFSCMSHHLLWGLYLFAICRKAGYSVFSLQYCWLPKGRLHTQCISIAPTALLWHLDTRSLRPKGALHRLD